MVSMRAAALVIALLLSACGNSTAPEPTVIDLTGDWSGSYSRSGAYEIRITQMGTSINGFGCFWDSGFVSPSNNPVTGTYPAIQFVVSGQQLTGAVDGSGTVIPLFRPVGIQVVVLGRITRTSRLCLPPR